MFEPGDAGTRVRNAGLYPEKPMVTDEEWNRIWKYFLDHAPEQLSSGFDFSTLPVSSQFSIQLPPLKIKAPSVTMLEWHRDGIKLGDASTGRYFELRPDFSIRRAGELEQAPVDMAAGDGAHFVAVMGSFSPTDAASGMLVKLPDDTKNPPSVEIDSLQRPVQVLRHDWNEDGRPDFLICEFGKFTGSLSWYLAKPEGGYEKSPLRSRPGATHAELADMNGDGRKDVIALFGQADECVEAFISKGNGGFDVHRLLTFPPCFGSSGFQLADLDADGDAEIILTAGDNADFFPVVKPYHGVYIYKNQGDLKFEKQDFLHLPGAYAVRMADFNLDGLQDLAAISFFPDWSGPEPADFVIWYGKSTGGRRAERLPLADYGRWILMDAGDADADGDTDLVLASLMMEPKPDNGRMNKWLGRQLPLLLLKNRARN